MNTSKLDATYKRFRWQIILATFLTYTVMYISRKAFAAAAPLLMEDLGMTVVQFGAALLFITSFTGYLNLALAWLLTASIRAPFLVLFLS